MPRKSGGGDYPAAPSDQILDMRDSNPQPSVFKQTLYPIELIVFGEFYSDQHGG